MSFNYLVLIINQDANILLDNQITYAIDISLRCIL